MAYTAEQFNSRLQQQRSRKTLREIRFHQAVIGEAEAECPALNIWHLARLKEAKGTQATPR